MDDETAYHYQRAKLAMLTGWTFEHIDNMGALDFNEVLEVHEAEEMVRVSLRNAHGSKRR